MLLIVLFGIIEFGSAFNNYSVLRQAVRDGARQGAVGNFGPTASCTLNFTGGIDPGAGEVKNLMCQTKATMSGGGLGMAASHIAVMVAFAKADLSGAAVAPQAAVGNGLIVCAQYPLQSLTGFFAQILGGKVLRSKTIMRIEVAGAALDSTGQEAAPAGSDWSWCNATSSSP
jgi:hypothetical protein